MPCSRASMALAWTYHHSIQGLMSKTSETLERAEQLFRVACLDPDSPFAPKVARYLNQADLADLLRAILRETRDEQTSGSSPPRSALLERLLERGLVRQVGEPAPKHGETAYWLVLRGGHSGIRPLELLAALDRRGIVSHFSALLFHELTDLRARYQFLTIPSKRVARQRSSPNEPRPGPETAGTSDPVRRQPRLGTARLHLEGVTYRTRTLVDEKAFGFETVWVDELETIRVYDAARTLLDTLGDPACNGGVRGVLEAWEKAADLPPNKLCIERMVEYLNRLNSHTLWLRAGTMAAHVGLTAVEVAAHAVVLPEDSERPPRPLVPGLTAGSVVQPWNVLVPW